MGGVAELSCGSCGAVAARVGHMAGYARNILIQSIARLESHKNDKIYMKCLISESRLLNSDPIRLQRAILVVLQLPSPATALRPC